VERACYGLIFASPRDFWACYGQSSFFSYLPVSLFLNIFHKLPVIPRNLLIDRKLKTSVQYNFNLQVKEQNLVVDCKFSVIYSKNFGFPKESTFKFKFKAS
jgi:hypothetical protein